VEAELTPEEAARLDHIVSDDGQAVLAKREDGCCVYLVDNKCSIYADRPVVCKWYDCRIDLIIGYLPEGDAIMQEALKSWAPIKTPTADDKVASVAIRLAVADGGCPAGCKEAAHKAGNWPRYTDRAKALLWELTKLKATDPAKYKAWFKAPQELPNED